MGAHHMIFGGFLVFVLWFVAMVVGVVEARKYGLPSWLGFLVGLFGHFAGVILLVVFMWAVDHLSPGPAQGPYRIDSASRPPV